MSDEYLRGVIEEALESYPQAYGCPTGRGMVTDLSKEEIREQLAEHIAHDLRLSKDPMRRGGLPEDDVHVDWHMTPDEWTEMRGALLNALPYSKYVQRLHQEGKLRGR